MRQLLVGAILLTAGCSSEPTKPTAPFATPTPSATPSAIASAAVADPNVLIYKCSGSGTSTFALAGTTPNTDPANEETFVRVDLSKKTLQTWVIRSWSEACYGGGKCDATFDKKTLRYRTVTKENDGGKSEALTETWAIDRADGSFTHGDIDEQREGGKLALRRDTTNKGTCVPAGEPVA